MNNEISIITIEFLDGKIISLKHDGKIVLNPKTNEQFAVWYPRTPKIEPISEFDVILYSCFCKKASVVKTLKFSNVKQIHYMNEINLINAVDYEQ